MKSSWITLKNDIKTLHQRHPTPFAQESLRKAKLDERPALHMATATSFGSDAGEAFVGTATVGLFAG